MNVCGRIVKVLDACGGGSGTFAHGPCSVTWDLPRMPLPVPLRTSRSFACGTPATTSGLQGSPSATNDKQMLLRLVY